MRVLQQGEFLRRHHGHFLLSTDDDAASGPWNLGIFPIVRRTLIGDPDWISIGRDRVCDIVLRHASVSKVHARLRRTAHGLLVADARSKNGTRVNGDPLVQGERRVIGALDWIELGQVRALVLDAGRMFDLLAGSDESRV